MIVKDFYGEIELYNGTKLKLFRTYSDRNFYIQNEDGILYTEAVDVETANHTYIETTELIEDQFVKEEERGR